MYFYLVEKSILKPLLINSTLWLIYYFLLVSFLSERVATDIAMTRALIIIAPQMLLVYLNNQYLIPKYLIKNDFWKYGIAAALMFGFLWLYFSLFIEQIAFRIPGGRFGPSDEIVNRWRQMRPKGGPLNLTRPALFMSLAQSVGIIVLSSVFKTSQIASEKAKETAELKSENLNSELKFLKSQVNPHFLFNSLNNLYALAIKKSEKTPDIILKLSDILRYMIYDGEENKVPLRKEVQYLKNYIDLFKLKDEDIKNIKVHFDEIPDSVIVEPMLFIPFVENSFKHSKIEDLDNGWISIDMKLDKNKITFTVANSIPATKHSKDEVGGIGLENITRRLSLLYPDRHELSINTEAEKFTVNLTLLL